MRIPISWLKDYVDFDLSPEALEELLTNAGLEGTGLERIGVEGADLVWERDKVLLGQILRVERHPDADKLVLATVEYGAEEPKVVVTGAPNLFPFLDAGDLTERRIFSPMVLEGATYLDPYKNGKKTRLKGKKLRGIYNDAMLCSPVELGLGEDHEGILLLTEEDSTSSFTAGTPLQDVLGDVVLEIDIIPNIARCASLLGVAREVAALTGTEVRPPSYDVVTDGPSAAGRVELRTEEPALNPRFCAFIIEGVEQKPSPFWMQHRLRLAGQRPINVVVDISNYVMLEVGQPNHTFDYDFLRQRADRYAPEGPIQLITRLAEEGETLVTLDGAEHKLRRNNILVTDPEGNLSLGGIMGGQNSEIEDHTTNVLLEAAAWKFTNIRQTQRQLGLQTDAGFRFSRGVHPSQAELGARRAAELLRRLAGGTVADGLIDYQALPSEDVTVRLDPDYVRRLSGLDIDTTEIAELLRRPGFRVETDGEALQVTAPDYRLDIEGPHDLVEEVCRLYGYDRIPSTLLRDALPIQRGNPELEAEERLKDSLVELGYREVITYRLTTPEAEARATSGEATDDYIRITNPSTTERVVMRHDLLASVLEIAMANSRFARRIALFEIGNVFPMESGEALPQEIPKLAIVLLGRRTSSHWQADESEFLDFFDLKGTVEALADEAELELSFHAAEAPGFRPGRTAELRLESGEPVGVVGELHPQVLERYDHRLEDDQPVLAAHLDLDLLMPHILATSSAVDPVPVYPAVREDLALVVDEGMPAAEVEAALRKAGAPLLTDLELFDVYTGANLADGKKSLAYHLTLQSRSKTLKDKDTEKLRRRILKQVEQSVGAVLR